MVVCPPGAVYCMHCLKIDQDTSCGSEPAINKILYLQHNIIFKPFNVVLSSITLSTIIIIHTKVKYECNNYMGGPNNIMWTRRKKPDTNFVNVP